MLHNITDQYITDIERINQAGQPGVCALSAQEIKNHRANARFFKVAIIDNDCVTYVIAYDNQQDYDGDEFNWFKHNVQQPFLYIDQIAIDATQQGKGLGSKIYNQLKTLAVQQDYKYITCEVNVEPPNPISLKFHHKNGFVQTGELVASDGRCVALLKLSL